MDAFSSLPGGLGIILTLLVMVWGFMWLLVPFAIYSIYKSGLKQVAFQADILLELKKLNRGIEIILRDSD